LSGTEPHIANKNIFYYQVINDQYSEARNLHKKYKNQNVSAVEDWKTRTKNDFNEFKAAGIQSDDFNRILKLIQE
jgi:hypothetical protein